MNKVIKYINSKELTDKDITEITIQVPKGTKAMVVTYLYNISNGYAMLTSTIPSDMIEEAMDNDVRS